ncbi:recombinase family protein [bacterium]|nr:recombinase family protein [bacterium]
MRPRHPDGGHDIFAKSHGYEAVSWHTDRAVSNEMLEYAALQRLLEDSCRGQLEVALVPKVDQVAPGLLAQLWLEKELLRSNVEIISVAEPFRG